MGFWEAFFNALFGRVNTSSYGEETEEESGRQLNLNYYRNKCGTCINWTGAREQSYLGIGTRYVTVYQDKARCAANGYSGSDNYHYAGPCRNKGHYPPCANLTT